METLHKIMTQDNSIEEFILEMNYPITIEEYENLILEYLPRVKKVYLYISDKNGVSLSYLIKIGLIKPIPKSFRLICITQLKLLDQGVNFAQIF